MERELHGGEAYAFFSRELPAYPGAPERSKFEEILAFPSIFVAGVAIIAYVIFKVRHIEFNLSFDKYAGEGK